MGTIEPSADAAEPDTGEDAAIVDADLDTAIVDIAHSGDLPPGACAQPLPPIRPGYVAFHCSPIAQWEIHDPAVYQSSREGFDEMIELLDRGYLAVLSRLGHPLALPLRVVVDPGACCGASNAPGELSHADGNFGDRTALAWTRGIILQSVVNGVVNGVSTGWPADWWRDSGYFSGMVVASALEELLGPAVAAAWEAREEYRQQPIYLSFLALRDEQGWSLFERLFDLVDNDQISWTDIGPNPSALRTNYVLAYLSVAAGRNLGATFAAAGVEGADAAMVQAIIDARARLLKGEAGGGDMAAGWAAFRAGDYMTVGIQDR